VSDPGIPTDQPTDEPTDRHSGDKVATLAEAVRHVRAGDAVHVMCSHTRFSAVARALVREWWGRDPQWTLVMLSLSSLGAMFFPIDGVSGGLVRKVVTGYSGDVFPNFTPNRRFGSAYLSGAVEVEHWSFLTFAQRMEAAARGLPALTTASLRGSSMADNAGYAEVESPFGPVGLLEAFSPDVALVHAAVADRAGNLAFHPPLLEGVWGALAARRGVVASVERIVDDITPWAHLVLAVAEAPMGAHPGGLYGSFTPAEPYAEDLAFWVSARNATRADDYSYAEWIQEWVLGPADQAEYLDALGTDRIADLRGRADRGSWRADEAAHPPDLDVGTNDWELAAIHGARVLADRLVDTAADAVLAGAGVANLATWLAVEKARGRGAPTVLTAELGLLGYEPTPADPFVFNHRAFPSATMLADAETVLGGLVPGPATSCLGCLGAAQIDAAGNINSTEVPGRTFLVGSGGGNDVASTADEVVVVTTLTPRRTVAEGATPESIDELLGWPLVVAGDCAVLDPPGADEVERLRRWDPQGLFLRG
jgi:acyl CoA:acetate/3-ketoacid CoA transferase alpha subunit/acyl CoA:acetate/3-ketoacid CoA transferase beta subunit